MFHELVIEHIVEVKSTKTQVNENSSDVRHHPQADYLTKSFILRPRGRVDVWSEDVMVSDVQYMVHGAICESKAVQIMVMTQQQITLIMKKISDTNVTLLV